MLSLSMHKFDDEFIYSGLSVALGHELGSSGVGISYGLIQQNT
jgi:hypothetical protein